MIKNSRQITQRIIRGDNVINWVLGTALILAPDFFNRLLFGQEVLSHWLYIVLGVGFIWFAAWQVETFLNPEELEKPALRFSALLAWGPVLALTIILLSLGERMILFSKIVLWLANLYMLLLGIWYWWTAEQLN